LDVEEEEALGDWVLQLISRLQEMADQLRSYLWGKMDISIYQTA
jgi:hypothetical protein